MRVGVRKNMMPFGRERLAESAYQSAVAEMAKENPDKCKALWNLNVATNLNPHYTEAIDMKEELTGKVITSSDNSSIRQFVMNQILEDKLHPTTTQSPPREVPITATTQPTAMLPGEPTTQPVVAMSPATKPSTQPTFAVAPAKNSASHDPKSGDENAKPTKVTDLKSADDEDNN